MQTLDEMCLEAQLLERAARPVNKKVEQEAAWKLNRKSRQTEQGRL